MFAGLGCFACSFPDTTSRLWDVGGHRSKCAQIEKRETTWPQIGAINILANGPECS